MVYICTGTEQEMKSLEGRFVEGTYSPFESGEDEAQPRNAGQSTSPPLTS